MRKDITKEDILRAIERSPLSMQGAARVLNLPYRTFIYRAQKYGVYAPNPAGIGVNTRRKPLKENAIPLRDILDGKHPQYKNVELKKRLVAEGYMKYECACCKNDGTWLGKALTLQLNHIDGNRHNHRLENLEFLCPNCHTQTDTWGGRNKNKKEVSDEEMIQALQTTTSIADAMRTLEISISKTNYERAKKLKMKIKGLVWNESPVPKGVGVRVSPSPP